MKKILAVALAAIMLLGLVNIGAGSKDKNIKATNGDVTVKADTGANVINVTAAMAGSGGKAVGLSANVNVFNRKSEVEIAGGDEYVIRAGGNVQAAPARARPSAATCPSWWA